MIVMFITVVGVYRVVFLGVMFSKSVMKWVTERAMERRKSGGAQRERLRRIARQRESNELEHIRRKTL